MWIKTVDDEAINLDNIVEIKAKYYRNSDYTVVEATAVNNQQIYFLWQHEGEAVLAAKKWIDKNILKTEGDTDDKAYAVPCSGVPVHCTARYIHENIHGL
jgi:hypothetical protein